MTPPADATPDAEDDEERSWRDRQHDFYLSGLPHHLAMIAHSAKAGDASAVAEAAPEPRTEFSIALDVAAASAAFFAAASAVTGFLTFLNVTQTPLSLDRDFGTKLSYFIGSIEVGQAWLITTLLAAVVTVLCFAVRNQTALVFVTAYDDAAVQAFDLHAVDYLLKPLRADRLGEAVRRVVEARGEPAPPPPEEKVAVELGGVTRWVPVSVWPSWPVSSWNRLPASRN